MPDISKQLNDLEKRITNLENGAFGVDPITHPLTQQNFKYEASKLISSGIEGRSHAPTTTTIPINQGGVPQLLDFATNDFANGITWDSANHQFKVVTAGKYLVICTVRFLNLHMQDGAGYSALIYQNGSSVAFSEVLGGIGSEPLVVTISDILSCAASDTIKFYMETSSNSTMTIDVASGAICKV